MEPFHFTSSGRRLFGVYHPPLSDADRDTGVVLCHPTGQEYIRSHRVFLKLAMRLSEAGFYTFRFDLSGCGDSEGDFEQGDLELWARDTATALRELQEGSAVARLCLVGLRLGGSIAAITAAAQHESLEGLVLWDPVVEGKRYLDEIRARHQQWWRGSFARTRQSGKTPTALTPESSCEEILGFPLSKALGTSLENLDLLRLGNRPAKRTLLMYTQETDTPADLLEKFRELGSDAESQYVPAPPVWMKQKDELDNVTVAPAVLDTIVGWIERCFA